MPQCQFLFSAVFVFQKSYTGNILGIGRNKAWSSYFPDTRWSPKQRRRRARRWPHHLVARVHPWSRHHLVRALLVPSDIAPPPINSPRGKNPKWIGLSPRKVPQRCRHRRWSLGDRSLCSGTLLGWGIAPGAISTNSTTISIAVAISHDEEGVVLPRGWGLYR
jgi:hypothetical protein